MVKSPGEIFFRQEFSSAHFEISPTPVCACHRPSPEILDYENAIQPMTLKNNSELRQLAIAAACFLAEGQRPSEFKAKLGHEESYIARLLAAAESCGYLSRAPVVLRHNINPEDWAAVQKRFFQERDITSRLRHLLPRPDHFFEATMVPGDYDGFLRIAATHIGYVVRGSDLAGVMWGRTIFRLVGFLQWLSGKLDRTRLSKIECIPLCGDPIFLMNQRRLELEYSASWLAPTLETALTGKKRPPFPCLFGVPAYVSRATRAAAVADRRAGVRNDLRWRGSFEQIPGYKAIFRRPGRRVDEVDTIITGAGIVVTQGDTLEVSTGDLIEERLQQEDDLTKEQLDRLIWGDIGGWLIEKPNLKPSERNLVEDLNRGWTGATVHDLIRVANAAQRGKRPGVILVARGAAKAGLVTETIRRGLVNTLLLDSDLVGQIERLGKEQSG
jgi:hypothetical protein